MEVVQAAAREVEEMYQRIVTSEWSRPRQLTGQRRLLVESPNPLMEVADFNAFQEAGFEVAVCGGPDPAGPCPLAGDEECPFVLVSDVVLCGLDPETGSGHAVVSALRRHHPETAVVVAYAAGDQAALAAIPEGCTPLPLPASMEETIAILNAAADRAPARSTSTCLRVTPAGPVRRAGVTRTRVHTRTMASTAPAGGTPDPDALPAGRFSEWRRGMLAALAGAATAEVPCGACTACCRSSMFVHIGPDELETLRRVPRALLFPAPGRPAGHKVMGYDEHGRCPMLLDDRCSIYDHRPQTCRTFDCRVFPAAGLSPDGDAKRPIARQAARWRFDHPTPTDAEGHAGVRKAAAFLLAHPDRLPDGRAVDVTRLAVLAVEAGGPERFLHRRDPADES